MTDPLTENITIRGLIADELMTFAEALRNAVRDAESAGDMFDTVNTICNEAEQRAKWLRRER